MEDAKAHEMSDVFFPELPVPIRPSQVRSGEKEEGMGKREERNLRKSVVQARESGNFFSLGDLYLLSSDPKRSPTSPGHALPHAHEIPSPSLQR